MSTITIPVSKERPEDDVLELVELCEKLYPDANIKLSNALVIEVDNDTLATLFRKLAVAPAPVKAAGASRKYAQKAGKRNNGSSLVVENAADLEALKDIGLQEL